MMPEQSACGVDARLRALRSDPGYSSREKAFNEAIKNALPRATDAVVVLPVVVHIVRNDPYTMTDLDVQNGIQLLNDAFSKSGIYAASNGVDTHIQFCLAQTDPWGGITNGITRTVSEFGEDLSTSTEDNKLKSLIVWDPDHYINIWIVSNMHGEAYAKFTCGSWIRLTIGGYATMPPGGGNTDGIVVSGFGEVLAHEMGHYMGLYHTFEGGCLNIDCMLDGDRVCDTPPDNNVLSSPACNMPDNSCDTDTLSAHSNGFFPTDVPDQIANFMDYGNQSCKNEFTQGQTDRMQATIAGPRSGLLNSRCNPPCGDHILSSFTRDISDPSVGDVIHFTNTSTGASNYEWIVNGTVVATTTDFNFTPTAIGTDTIVLKSFNTPGCYSMYLDIVFTRCGAPRARFWANEETIASLTGVYEDSIHFTNTSTGSTSFSWQVSNDGGASWTQVSTNTDLTFVFPTPGVWLIQLVATDGVCSDTTSAYSVMVDNPTADGSPFDTEVSCNGNGQLNIDFCLANYGYAPLPVNSLVSFYNGSPYLPSTQLIGSPMHLPYDVPGGRCYVCYSFTLNPGTVPVDEIWVVFNDSGLVVPISLPNTPFPENSYYNNIDFVPVSNRTWISASICEGQSYTGHTLSGTYIDTLTSMLTGCDSIRTLYLNVKPKTYSTVNASICQGDNYEGHTASGTYINTFTSATGCDSIRTLHLTVKQPVSSTISASICEGESFESYNTSGTYTDTFTGSNGCDSVRTLNLTVKPKRYSTNQISICQGEQYAGHASTGTFTDTYTAANGCDSIRTLYLTVNPKKITNLYPEICRGESYFAGGALRYTSGNYFDTLNTYLGCDSIVITHLTVHELPKPDLGSSHGICANSYSILDPGNFESYLWQDGSTNPTYQATAFGIYYVTVKDQYGCVGKDTTYINEIFPVPDDFLSGDTSLCLGNSVVLHTGEYISYLWSTGATSRTITVTQSGIYRLTVTNYYGCVGKDSATVIFYTDCLDLQIPNAFTPNGDGLNDYFKPFVPAPLRDFNMQIWDRWGKMMFESDDYTKGWDGSFKGVQQPPAAYIYTIHYKTRDGKFFRKKGSVILIR